MTGSNALILIGGGHYVGKEEMALCIKENVEQLVKSSVTIEVINMETYKDPHIVTTSQGGKNAAITVGANRLLHLKPSRFDFEALKKDLRSTLATGKDTEQKLVIVHGLYALYDKELCEMAQIKVYVGGDADNRLIRWIKKEVLSNSLNQPMALEHVINSYLHGARDEMRDYIFPTKERADIIFPRGTETKAVALIADGILAFLGSSPSLESAASMLRPTESTFQTERFNNEKGKYYELN